MSDSAYRIVVGGSLHPDTLLRRVEVSSGVERPARTSDYYPDARVPSLPFRPLSCPFVESDGASRESGNTIATLDLNETLDSGVRSELIEAQSYDDIQRCVARVEFRRLCDQLVRRFELELGFDGNVEVRGVSLKAPGLSTVTFDNSRRLYVGLHLDSNDRASIYERSSSRNRLSINLGTQPRRFLFQDCSVAGIIDRLAACGSGDLPASTASALAPIFLGKISAYPVVALRVEPGEAYVAPTENIIHDATTYGMTAMDISLTFLGRFKPKRGTYFLLPSEETLPAPHGR